MKRNLIFVLTIILFMAKISTALTIKLGSLAPTASPWDDGLRKFSAECQNLSNNKIKIKIYSGGITGDEEDMIRKMQIGQLNAAAITGVGLSRIFSGILAVQLPLLVRTDDELYYVIKKMTPTFEKKLEEKGFKVLLWSKVGWVHFFSKKPVIYPDDLRKQKQFVWSGDPAGVQAWKNAGFQPIPLQVTDLMTSLQSGMIESFTTTPLSSASYQWFGLAKNMCDMRWAPLIGGIVITTKTWKKITPELQIKIRTSLTKVGMEMQKEIDNADKQAIKIMKENGLIVNEVPQDAIKKWNDAVAKDFDKLIGKSFDAKSYEMVKMILKEYRNNHGK